MHDTFGPVPATLDAHVDARENAAVGPPVDALVDALLAGRPTPANDRFDEEIAAAIAQGHLDAATGRALRYRQRASVRAVETYLQLTLGPLLHSREAAARAAQIDAAADDQAWLQAQQIAAERTGPAAPAVPQAQPGTRLVAVPDYVPAAEQSDERAHRTADETRLAIRAALHSTQLTDPLGSDARW